MKKLTSILVIAFSLLQLNTMAQEKFGNTLNLGIGVGGRTGYYGYASRSLPVFHLNYEFDVAKDFTLAPFISVSSFTNDYYWGNNNNPYKYYTYRETIIPVGVKGSYYFDNLLKANKKWDFYLAGSIGFAIINQSWDNGYNGDKNYYRGGSNLFLDIHIGTEYHFNNNIGAFLDLSSGVSTIGLAFHGKK
ncbi:MAG: hypothetical protein ACEQSR_08790 [Candidatus Methylacidiphilales bacterium]